MAQERRFRAGPTRKALWLLVLSVLILHALLLLGASVPLQLQLNPSTPKAPIQIRVVQTVPAPVPKPPAPPRTKAPRAAVPSPLPPEASEPEVPMVAAEQTLAEASSAPPQEPALAAVPPPATDQSPSVSVTSWPLISLGALPSSRVLAYQLTGMDKGLTYHASGELRWQHNDTAYELTLSVRAFLLGSRQWRSVGRIDATGLAPRRFSDSWRNERAAHFDREQQRIVFSSNSKPAPLELGAQDQVSLYMQLAAAMAGEPERFAPGTRLQVQTATVRDAVPWALVQQGVETLEFRGQPVQVTKWVCQPRNQFEAKVEFWAAAEQAWMPLRIRITQASGSYIDLLWRSTDLLPPLPVAADSSVPAQGS
ncbi:MAG: DUF3108 domain-containing protein [Limnohabitans sp.]